VSSTFDDPVHGTNERPYVVVFERDGRQRGHLRDGVRAERRVRDLERVRHGGLRLLARRRNASVATDGTSFFLLYDELFFGAGPGGTDYDVHAVSGGLWSYAGGIAGSRWRSGTGVARLRPRDDAGGDVLLGRRVGSPGRRVDGLGAARGAASGGSLWFQRYDSATTEGSELQRSVSSTAWRTGTRTATPTAEPRPSSRPAATRRSGSIQQLWCEEMKQNAFAYFIVSRPRGT
jgi:hypothetical protein